MLHVQWGHSLQTLFAKGRLLRPGKLRFLKAIDFEKTWAGFSKLMGQLKKTSGLEKVCMNKDRFYCRLCLGINS